jgi:hypothetical protein
MKSSIFAAPLKVADPNTGNTLEGVEAEKLKFIKKSLLNQNNSLPLQSQIFRGLEGFIRYLRF